MRNPSTNLMAVSPMESMTNSHSLNSGQGVISPVSFRCSSTVRYPSNGNLHTYSNEHQNGVILMAKKYDEQEFDNILSRKSSGSSTESQDGMKTSVKSLNDTFNGQNSSGGSSVKAKIALFSVYSDSSNKIISKNSNKLCSEEISERKTELLLLRRSLTHGHDNDQRKNIFASCNVLDKRRHFNFNGRSQSSFEITNGIETYPRDMPLKQSCLGSGTSLNEKTISINNDQHRSSLSKLNSSSENTFGHVSEAGNMCHISHNINGKSIDAVGFKTISGSTLCSRYSNCRQKVDKRISAPLSTTFNNTLQHGSDSSRIPLNHNSEQTVLNSQRLFKTDYNNSPVDNVVKTFKAATRSSSFTSSSNVRAWSDVETLLPVSTNISTNYRLHGSCQAIASSSSFQINSCLVTGTIAPSFNIKKDDELDGCNHIAKQVELKVKELPSSPSPINMSGSFLKPNSEHRKLSVPIFSPTGVNVRHKKDPIPSRPSSLIETGNNSEKELKVFEIGNLGGDNVTNRGNYSVSTSVCSSQTDLLMDSSSSTAIPVQPTADSSSMELLGAFCGDNVSHNAPTRTVSVFDIRKAFEKADSQTGISPSSLDSKVSVVGNAGHNRMSSLDSSASEESNMPTPHHYGSVSSLLSGQTSLKDHYGSISSLASSTSLISPQELQGLIEEANQSLEESGTPSHEIMVVVIHREFASGSIGITLAGGADYECKDITVHKIIPGTLADRDGRIQKGDRVLSINGRSTKGVSHREALTILKSPRAEVVLVLSRNRSVTPAADSMMHDRPDGYHNFHGGGGYINVPSNRPPKILESPLDNKSLLSDLQFVDVPRGLPFMVVLKKEGTGLGFSLEGGKDSPFGDRPLTIKKIFTGGAGDKTNILRVGDEILAVNNADCTRMSRIEAWNYMKKLSDGTATLLIRQKLANLSSPPVSSTPVPTTANGTKSEAKR